MINFDEVKDKIRDYDIKHIISNETGFDFKRNNLSQCPFCGSGGGQNKSAAFSVKNNLYKCFSCDEGGDIIKFIEKLQSKDYKESLEYLSGKYIDLINIDSKIILPKYDKKKEVEHIADKEINKSFIDFIDTNVDDKEYKEIKSYLDSRNIIISDNVHILTNYQKVNDYLKKTFDIERLKKSGLFSDKNNLVFFNHRIIFSHYWNNEILFLHARTHKQDASFKYMYQKGKKIPFNLNAINTTYQDIYLVEGVFDALSLIQDSKQAISLGSVNVTKDTFKFITDKAKVNHHKITVLFDNDKAANDALKSDKYKEFAGMLKAANVSYSFEQTVLKDINDNYNDEVFLQDKIQDFYSWCLNTAKNDFWYNIENAMQLNTVKGAIDQAYNDVFGIELNTDKTKFRIIDLF